MEQKGDQCKYMEFQCYISKIVVKNRNNNDVYGLVD